MEFKRIQINHNRQNGRPCIKGTRITVYDILDYLDSGMSIQDIVANYPPLTEEDIHEALQFIKSMHAGTTYVNTGSAAS